jgi:hypothetical protein
MGGYLGTRDRVPRYKHDHRDMQEKDKDAITLKEASQMSGYSPDYLGQLIRQGKLPGKQVYSSVAWVTTEDAVRSYMDTAKSGAQREVIDSLGWGPEELARLYIYTGRALTIVLACTALLLFYIFSVTADHYIASRVEAARYDQP